MTTEMRYTMCGFALEITDRAQAAALADALDATPELNVTEIRYRVKGNKAKLMLSPAEPHMTREEAVAVVDRIINSSFS